jgi:uncharacterized protein YjbK
MYKLNHTTMDKIRREHTQYGCTLKDCTALQLLGHIEYMETSVTITLMNTKVALDANNMPHFEIDATLRSLRD